LLSSHMLVARQREYEERREREAEERRERRKAEAVLKAQQNDEESLEMLQSTAPGHGGGAWGTGPPGAWGGPPGGAGSWGDDEGDMVTGLMTVFHKGKEGQGKLGTTHMSDLEVLFLVSSLLLV
jgi:hypothetical protein